jgi:hypothetical protein
MRHRRCRRAEAPRRQDRSEIFPRLLDARKATDPAARVAPSTARDRTATPVALRYAASPLPLAANSPRHASCPASTRKPVHPLRSHRPGVASSRLAGAEPSSRCPSPGTIQPHGGLGPDPGGDLLSLVAPPGLQAVTALMTRGGDRPAAGASQAPDLCVIGSRRERLNRHPAVGFAAGQAGDNWLVPGRGQTPPGLRRGGAGWPIERPRRPIPRWAARAHGAKRPPPRVQVPVAGITRG